MNCQEVIEKEIKEATQLREEIAAKLYTMSKEEKAEQLRSIWETMKFLIDEKGEINDTAREIYEEIMVSLDTNLDDVDEELDTAHRVSDYIFMNAKTMDQMDLEEWAARLYDLLRTYGNTPKAHALLTEAMLNVGYYLDNYAANNPTAEAEDDYGPCDHGKKWGAKCDECKAESDEAEAMYGPCHHGKEYHEHCYKCQDEGEEADEREERIEKRIQKAVEYNLWYQDGGYKEVARMGY